MMRYDPERHHRRSIRLRGYDYAQPGAYFVTICTRNKELFFEDDGIRIIAERCWLAIPKHFPYVQLDAWVVMPNHVHGVLWIVRRGVQLNAPTRGISPRRGTLSVVVRTYKAAVTTQCRRDGYGYFGWQRNYYEHIVRNEEELNRIREYIFNNPLRWHLDRENPERVGEDDFDRWLNKVSERLVEGGTNHV